MVPECIICKGLADDEFKRVEVWKTDNWRLTMSKFRIAEGFCYIEPRKHIPSITDMNPEEAGEFGVVLARVSSALKAVTKSKLIYVYIFGDHIPHLHIHLAPHRDGDVYTNDVIRSGVEHDESTYSMEHMNVLLNELRGALNSLF